MRFVPALLLPVLLGAADPGGFGEVSRAAKRGDLGAIQKVIPEDRLKKGSGWYGVGGDFLFLVESKERPQVVIDEGSPKPMVRLKKTGYWYATAKLETSRTHNYHYVAGGKTFGGANDVPAFGPESYERPGVPKGKLSEKRVHTSQIYPGMKSDYWVYAPAQYDGKTPAAVMVWQDGEVLVNREMPSRAQVVFDNLTAQKKIPVIIHVLLSPGWVDKQRMRSIEYDTMDDKYVRFLRDEVLPEVEKEYKLRHDGYSRAIAGDSSGGICAFNAAYTHPEMFARALSRIGSFTSIQWHPGKIDGGNVYPFKIRKEPRRNIRVWLQDGAGDLENEHGSWPGTNLGMANSLKRMEYDFHFSFGNGTHSRNGGHAELAEEMIWLWRGYDAAKTEETFVMDPAEKDREYFRIKMLNREAGVR